VVCSERTSSMERYSTSSEILIAVYANNLLKTLGIQLPSPEFDISCTSEDCLYLDVWVPELNETPLPVMIFIHGGGLVLGTGANYFGAYLANLTGVIIVTFNYRLGVFGTI